MITKNHFVSLAYELRDVNNELIEETDEKNPLEFICGQGQMLEYFEMNLLGLNAGDSFDFCLPAARAYGETREEMIVRLPREIFRDMDEEDLAVGNLLPMQDSMGRRLSGTIKEIDNDIVTMDFNHRLSGVDLHFKGRILHTRAATDEELERLGAHACGGCHSCGSDSGCCH
ncbi:MAG: peptidylprolyl isomerase [Odoribacteraceae bacterium]|jgi:FKBP-type peptidyl-prolyl cis-trans isomerase SlyD|nr:peptidylprolyl isomerase [Odoribacteraceae bacterium]